LILDSWFLILNYKIMKNLTILFFALLFINITATSQPCLPEGIYITTQAEIDSFQINYPNCTEIEGDVRIKAIFGTNITNLDGLSALTFIGGDLEIGGVTGTFPAGNPYLTSLSGLANLTFVGGYFQIAYNSSLTNLTGLNNINAASIEDLYIYNNNSLSTCEVERVCNYLAAPNGVVLIENNAPGCNSPNEVAEACELPCPFDIDFSSQLQIDSFQVTYPGCIEIGGNVTINGDDITNLDGLNVLTTIWGDLVIGFSSWGGGNPLLTTLEGLENITFIGGNLIIGDDYNPINGNPSLINLSGLDNLVSVGLNLEVYNNEELSSLSGLESLVSIGGDFEIYHNESMIDFTGLESLTSIGENLSINDNESLVNLSGLTELTFIGGALGIYSNESMTSLTGLENMTSLGGYLEIKWNDSLASLSGLESLNSINGMLVITTNGVLTSLTGLENLTSIEGELYIMNNSELTSLIGMENLTSIGERLWISWNGSLVNVSGLEGLTSIGGDLWLNYNYTLTSLAGLDNIEASSITNLRIFGNSELATCAVQSICDYLAAPNGTIEIHDNAPGCNSQEEVQYVCDSIFTFVSELPEEVSFTIIPNPLKSETVISYTLNESTHTTLKILSKLNYLFSRDKNRV